MKRRSTLPYDLAVISFWLGFSIFYVINGKWWDLPPVLAVVLIMLISRQRARMTYRNGWWDGRLEMLNSLEEAQRRGMEAQEWIDSQVEKEAALMADKHWPVI